MKKHFLKENKKKISILLTFFLLCLTSAFVLVKPKAEEATSCGQIASATPDGVGGCVTPIVDNSSQTIKGEVLSNLNKLGEPGNSCAKFRLGISGHHDIVILEKTALPEMDADLTKCQEVAKSLEKAYADGTAKANAVSGVSQPFREGYYYERNYPEQIVIPDKNFTFFHDINTDNNWKYDKNYYDYFYNDYPNNQGGVATIQNFCRVHLEEKTNKLLAYEIRYRPVSGAQNISKCAMVPLTWTCNHKEVYTYGLRYDISQSGVSTPISATEPHKCEEIKMTFTPSSEWFQTLTKASDNVTAVNNIVPLSHDMFVSPPTNILSCADQASCLTAATKQTTGDTATAENGGVFWGKGAQKVPSNFVATTQSSVNAGDDSGIKCVDGKCTAYISGSHSFNSTIPASSYFGQCGNDLITVDLPEATIPSVKSTSGINIINRPPVVTVGFSKTTLAKNEEIEVTCDAVDADTCSDKVTKIKWKCFDSTGNATACYFGKNGIWKAGDLLEEIPESSATNPYRSTAKFKVDADGNYAVSCEAWDNDKVALNSNGQSGSSSSIGLAGLNVGGVIAAEMNFCAIIPDSEESDKTACGETGKAKFKAYYFGIEPQTYRWQCSKESAVDSNTSDKKECAYATQGSFLPSLKIVGKDGVEHTCTSVSNIKITNSPKCKVLSRVVGSTEDYSSNLQIQEGTEVESIVKVECLKLNSPKWNVTNGTTTSTENDKLKAKFNTAGNGSIGASLTKDKTTTTCEGSSITVKAKVMQGVQ